MIAVYVGIGYLVAVAIAVLFIVPMCVVACRDDQETGRHV
jgi:hypothetical protein